jgi:hypothetical protein
MMNLGLAGAILLNKLQELRFPPQTLWLRWSPVLNEVAKQAILAAHNRATCVSCFPMWHKNQLGVEILSSTHLRFSASTSQIDRRIRAQQQGARIPNWPSTPDNPVDKSFVENSTVNHLLSKLWTKVTLEGALAMSYPDDNELLSVLRDIYDIRLQNAFRHDPNLDLGGYDLGEFRKFFAALLSLCTIHEYLCDQWSKARNQYPFESAVLVKSVTRWIGLIAHLSGVGEEQVRVMIHDLSFGTIRPLDIYIHPFMPSLDGRTLYLIPHFILNSRPEENILRVCSYARPRFYSVISKAKESQMRETIRQQAPPRFVIVGPVTLPDPKLPDIDLLIEDTQSESVLIGELKWLRKTSRVQERLDRESELNNGFQQLHEIRTFLEQYPDHLQKTNRLTSGYKPNFSYAVIARDHLNYKPQQDNFLIAEFDALIWALQNADNLEEALHKLQSFEWLPVEGREFKVQFRSSKVAGITIDAETFYRIGPN